MFCSVQCTSLSSPWLIPKNFIIFGALVHRRFSLISFLNCSLQCKEMQVKFVSWLCTLLLYWIHLLVITGVCVCVKSLGFSTCQIISSHAVVIWPKIRGQLLWVFLEFLLCLPPSSPVLCPLNPRHLNLHKLLFLWLLRPLGSVRVALSYSAIYTFLWAESLENNKVYLFVSLL